MTVDERIEAAVAALGRQFPGADLGELRAAIKEQREIVDGLFEYVADAKAAAREVGGSWTGEPLDECIRRIATEGAP